jgi:hypothetical protein
MLSLCKFLTLHLCTMDCVASETAAICNLKGVSACVLHIFRVCMRCSRVWMRCSRVWVRCSGVWMRCSQVWMRCSQVWIRCSRVWMRCTRVARASDSQCRSRNGPGFDPSILRHSGISGAADEAVLNKVPT